jgi:hypothetical protein
VDVIRAWPGSGRSDLKSNSHLGERPRRRLPLVTSRLSSTSIAFDPLLLAAEVSDYFVDVHFKPMARLWPGITQWNHYWKTK